MRLALAQSERRYGGVRIEDEGLVERLLLAKNDPPKPIIPAASPAVDRPSDPPTTAPAACSSIYSDGRLFAVCRPAGAAAGRGWQLGRKDAAPRREHFKTIRKVQDQRIHDLHLLTEPMVSDTYFSMIAYLEQRYYSSASRYTTSAFMRLKLGEGLSERHVAPHIFETRAEAQASREASGKKGRECCLAQAMAAPLTVD
jgi:hypothetical protein